MISGENCDEPWGGKEIKITCNGFPVIPSNCSMDLGVAIIYYDLSHVMMDLDGYIACIRTLIDRKHIILVLAIA